MAEEEPAVAAEGAQPQEAAAAGQPQDTAQGEAAQAQDPRRGEGTDATTPNVHKLERDVANRDKRIVELEAKLAASEKGGSDLEARIAALEKRATESATEAANARADAALTAAGCVDCELGRTALAAYDGDVDKLREAKPYLFGGGQRMSTGGSRSGSAGGVARNIREGLRAIN